MSTYTKIEQGRRAAIRAVNKAEAIAQAGDYLVKAQAATITAESYGPAALKARITAISNEIALLRNDMQEGKF